MLLLVKLYHIMNRKSTKKRQNYMKYYIFSLHKQIKSNRNCVRWYAKYVVVFKKYKTARIRFEHEQSFVKKFMSFFTQNRKFCIRLIP